MWRSLASRPRSAAARRSGSEGGGREFALERSRTQRLAAQPPPDRSNPCSVGVSGKVHWMYSCPVTT
jgi:hypothetical protein